MKLAGFQLSARFKTGDLVGSNAGQLIAVDPRATVVPDAESGIEYGQHTKSGVSLVSGGTSVWRMLWAAPRLSDSAVVFDLVGNAGNGDDSEFGDTIYALRCTLDRAQGPKPDGRPQREFYCSDPGQPATLQ